MVILEGPFLSKEMKNYLIQTRAPVLENEFAVQAGEGKLNCLNEQSFKELYEKGERIYTNSENALDWIYQNIEDITLLQSITLMKDKAAMRQALLPLHPDFFFLKVPADELAGIDFSKLKLPFVLKPSVGFFSEGVYVVENETDWKNALADISKKALLWKTQYPGSVVDNEQFILEQFIFGEEYAIDAYFNEDGKAVILNIMKHDFSSDADVSDRLYYTGKEIIEEKLSLFTDYLNRANEYLAVKNFPAHIEVREHSGVIIPIEFNPLRFAGLCTTDITLFAYGFRTYDYYLNKIVPDWRELLKSKENKYYTLILLNTTAATKDAHSFNFDKFCAQFENVLCLRKADHKIFPAFGFLFTETKKDNRLELDRIVKNNLKEFII